MRRQDGGSKERYLKGQNAIYLWSFISINIAVFLGLLASKALTESSLDHAWRQVTVKDGMIAAGIPILAIVFSGLLRDVGKARLVFWRWTHPLPGCRAFSELLAADPRIDVQGLKAKLGELPQEPQAQNALWYKLYRKHSSAPRVLEAHKLYLLIRDVTATAAVFVVLLPIGILFCTLAFRIAVAYSGALIVQYFFVATAARNYGERFVMNVLSEELHG